MLLLIPGPVTTNPRVRAAAAEDYAPWDHSFREIFARVRTRVNTLAGGDARHTCLALPGCGHFAMEAAVRSFVPAGGKLLLPITGQYADRIARLATEAGRVVVTLAVAPNQRVESGFRVPGLGGGRRYHAPGLRLQRDLDRHHP